MQDSLERNVGYGLMAAIFGLVPVVSIVSVLFGAPQLYRLYPSPIPSISPYAVLVAGVLGVVTGLNRVWGGRLSKPYDLLFGIVFSLIGLTVVLSPFYSEFSPSVVFPALVATYVGLSALYRGVQRPSSGQDKPAS